MKRIVDGVTYNTATSTRLAQSVWKDDDNDEITGTLYQTRGGAFFVHLTALKKVWIERLGETEERDWNRIVPMSGSEAHEWIMTGEVDVFSNPFEDPPEATAETEPGATIYVRVPAVLKQRVDRVAAKSMLSGNAWTMRCIEKCMESSDIRNSKELAYIWEIASTFRAHAEDGEWSKGTCIEALMEIADYLEEFVDENLSAGALNDVGLIFQGDETLLELKEKYKPYNRMESPSL
jgi:hypothetical protein